MKIGEMRHYITFQIKSDVKNEIGQTTKEWTEYKSTWAKKIRLKNTSNNNSGKEGISEEYRFITRFREDITEDMRIIYNSTIYNIDHVNNINELNIYETHIDVSLIKEGVYNE